MTVKALSRKPIADPKRRFTDKPSLDPSAVWSLPKGHAALSENRTLFPSTVVDVDENFEDHLLVSGENNRKLGKTVAKGAFKGYALFGLTLEERATCPGDCAARGYCYGNSMQMARRHRIVDLDYFESLLEDEIREILCDAPGLLVRLHVLGDFPSVEYVVLWASLLGRHPNLARYGYTHWPMGSDIGIALRGANGEHPDRFRIRWSGDKLRPDGAMVINEIPKGPRFNGAIVCPAQTDATACCASCGLCWEPNSAKETIAFIKHGKKAMDIAALAAAPETPAKSRPVAPVPLPSNCTPAIITDPCPQARLVDPKSLLIEGAYQRDLSGASIRLIRKIVSGWDWSKFKPPVCAETEEGLFVIDGQHTAIAAASHPSINEIPVLVASASLLHRRAAAFVAHNRDRLTMTPAQIFYGDLAAKDKNAQRVMEICVKAGASVPRLPVARGYGKPGQVAAVGELREICKLDQVLAERIVSIAVLSKSAPINNTLLRALRVLVTESVFERVRKSSNTSIAAAVSSIKDLDSCAREQGLVDGVSRFYGAAALIAEAMK